MNSPGPVSSPRCAKEESMRVSLKKAAKGKPKTTKAKLLKDMTSIERSMDKNSPGSSLLKPLQALQSRQKLSKATSKKAQVGVLIPPPLKVIPANKLLSTSNLKLYKSQTRLTSASKPGWVQDASKLAGKISDKKKLSHLSSPLGPKNLKSPLHKQANDHSVSSKPAKTISHILSNGKAPGDELEAKFIKLKSKKESRTSRSPASYLDSPQPNREFVIPSTSNNRSKIKPATSNSGSPSKNKKRKGKKVNISKKGKAYEVSGEGSSSRIFIQPPIKFQRHYLLGNVAEGRDSFSESSLQTDDHRRTIKLGAVEKLRDLEKSSIQDRTKKRFQLEDSKEKDIAAHEGSSENELVAETIQNFYRDWNSNIKEDERQPSSAEKHERLKSSIAYEQVKISFGAMDTPIPKESSKVSSAYDKDVSLCLSHTKYSQAKEIPKEDVYLLDRHRVVMAQQKKETLVKLHQKPEVYRSIYKLISSSKKNKEGKTSRLDVKNPTLNRDKTLQPIVKCEEINSPEGHKPEGQDVAEETAKCEETKTKFPPVPKINFSNWNTFAKEEYHKWTKVTNFLHVIEDKIGTKAAEEVIHLFKQLESFAEHSKKNLKEAFLPMETGMSNTNSDMGTLRHESSLKASSFFERRMAIKKVVPLEPLPSSGSCYPNQECEINPEIDDGDSPQLSRSGTEYKRQLEIITLEKWVNAPNPLRLSASTAKLEKQFGSM
jgi:hypothetical protein